MHVASAESLRIFAYSGVLYVKIISAMAVGKKSEVIRYVINISSALFLNRRFSHACIL